MSALVDHGFRAARGAWFAAFAAWALMCFAFDASEIVAVRGAVITGATSLLASLALLHSPRTVPVLVGALGVRAVLIASVSAALIVIASGALVAGASGACALAGCSLAWCIARNRARALRLACHATSFFGTVCVTLPILAATPLPASIAKALGVDAHVLGYGAAFPGRVVVASALALFGIALMVAAGIALLRAGGTADPTDPPRALVDHGIYARLRHPMIVGEIALVIAASLAVGTIGALAYALLFACVLAGPWRRAEERALLHRYRARYREYALRVRAFVPATTTMARTTSNASL